MREYGRPYYRAASTTTSSIHTRVRGVEVHIRTTPGESFFSICTEPDTRVHSSPTDAASTSVEQADEDETDDPRAAARAELAAATEEAARIRDELEHAGDTVDEATESTDRLSTKVEELRVQLAAADEELLFARRKQVAAREAYDDAQTRLRVAEQRVHTARRDAEA